ncbi:PAS domain S-box protein [Hydrogenophaga sp. IBVHS2]|uniref:PAS domain S-box protein n=1 Tax=Hydrogenophaga sp. IBVHS2 TaxID=1985170 RepID=UPI000A2EBF0C|nr:PAS domain S-box protein [Hydrogenophaga sp. IBVHS2]OSZ65766.1 hypothetical protein CAP38_06870 [Hydrogenophaga sp. IBVHS2]
MTTLPAPPDRPARERVLTWFLPLLPAITGVLLLALAIPANENSVGAELRTRATYRVERFADAYAAQIASVLARKASEIELLAAMASGPMPLPALREQMQQQKQRSSAYVWIGLTDAAGQVLAASDGLLEGISIAGRGVYVNGRQGLWFGSLHPPVALRQPLLDVGMSVPDELADIALPVQDAQGQLKGVMATHLNARYLEDLRAALLGSSGADLGLSLSLVDADGRLLLGSRSGWREGAWSELMALPAGQALQRQDDQGHEILIARAPVLPGDSDLRTGWQVVAAQPVAKALASVHALERDLLLWGGSATLLLGLSGFALARRLGRPFSNAERRLREQGEVLSAVVDAASDAIVGVDERGRVALSNPAAARIFGRPAEAMRDLPVEQLLPEAAGRPLLPWLAPAVSGDAGDAGVRQVGGLRADGTVLELEASVSEVRVRGQRLVTAILRDVTERSQAERALRRYRRELSELTQRLLDQEKTTTRRLAQTLHDQLGQTLGAIRLSFDALCSMRPADADTRWVAREHKLGELVDTAIAEVRQALVILRPPLLESAGLEAALDNEVRNRRGDAGPVELELVVSTEACQRRWPAEVEYAAFMVAREALSNALLHAGASRVQLTIAGHDDRLCVSVQDDGVGLSEHLEQGRPGHLGMVGMRERALAIGARLAVGSGPAGGTLVTLTWDARADTAGLSCTEA